MSDDRSCRRHLIRRAPFTEEDRALPLDKARSIPLGEARRIGREDFSILEVRRDADGFAHLRQVEIEGRTPAIASGLETVRVGRRGPLPGTGEATWEAIVETVVRVWLELERQPLQRELRGEGYSPSTIRRIAAGRGKWAGVVAEARRRIARR